VAIWSAVVFDIVEQTVGNLKNGLIGNILVGSEKEVNISDEPRNEMLTALMRGARLTEYQI
jgi:hypothetical protein